jgi:hypothetical protein
MTTPFDRDYFMDGVRTGRSNYENYRHMPEKTEAACASIIRYLGIREGDSLLDFGAALGTYVLGYRSLGVLAWGYDISRWAVDNCVQGAAPYMSNKMPLQKADYIVAKDVLEHIPMKELGAVLRFFMEGARKAVLICVPLTETENGPYIQDCDNQDSTHIIRWPLQQWTEFIQAAIDDEHADFLVSAGFRLPGLKEYGPIKHNGCGFFTLRKYTL